MNNILWDDLHPEEQLAIAMLGTGISLQFCNGIAVRTLRSIGLVRNSTLTVAGKTLRRRALLNELAA